MQMPFTREEIEVAGATVGVLAAFFGFIRWVLGVHWRNRAVAAEAQAAACAAQHDVAELREEWRTCRASHDQTQRDTWAAISNLTNLTAATREDVACIKGMLEMRGHR